jgi:hypothetical protein
MHHLQIETNIPAVIVDIWDGHNTLVKRLVGSSSPIVLFEKEEKTCIVGTDLPRGLYTIRISLPYISGGQKFEMPLVLNEVICLIKDISISFKAKFEIVENEN